MAYAFSAEKDAKEANTVKAANDANAEGRYFVKAIRLMALDRIMEDVPEAVVIPGTVNATLIDAELEAQHKAGWNLVQTMEAGGYCYLVFRRP